MNSMNNKTVWNFLTVSLFASFPLLYINSKVGTIIFTILLSLFVVAIISNYFLSVWFRKIMHNLSKIKPTNNVIVNLFCIYANIMTSFIAYQQNKKDVVIVFIAFAIASLVLILIELKVHRDK